MSKNLPLNSYAPKSQMATEEYVRRQNRRIVKAPKKRTTYKTPQRRRVYRRYPHKRSANNAIKLEIPECSAHYIKSLYNPWSTPAGVCIPCDLFPLPSQKVMVKRRFTVTLSSNGCGFCTFSPSITSNLGFGTYTTAGSTGGVNSLFNNGAAWTTSSIAFADLPYTSTDVITNAQIQGRIVAFGARARYIGVEDKRGGSYISLEEQDHQDLYADVNNNTIDLVKAFHNAWVTSPRGDGEWDVSVCYSGPVQPGEIDFVNFSSYPLRPSGNVSTNAIAPFILCFAGTSDMAGQLVDVECCMHVEYIGKKVPGKTVSHADTATYGKVLETTKETAAITSLRPQLQADGWGKFVQKVAQTIPKIIEVVGGAAASVATGNPMPLIMAGAGAVAPLMLGN